MLVLTAVKSCSVFYHANQIKPCRYQWWLNILIQLAKHCRLYFIKKKKKNPPSKSTTLCKQYTTQPFSELCRRWHIFDAKANTPTTQVDRTGKAEGSVLILLWASVGFSGLLNKRWLCKAHRHLQTRARLVTSPVWCVKARMWCGLRVVYSQFHQEPVEAWVWGLAPRQCLQDLPRQMCVRGYSVQGTGWADGGTDRLSISSRWLSAHSLHPHRPRSLTNFLLPHQDAWGSVMMPVSSFRKTNQHKFPCNQSFFFLSEKVR